MPRGVKNQPTATPPAATTTPPTATPPTTASGKINKLECVRQLIAKYGKAITPTEIVERLKAEYGADINAATASTYKGTILHKKKGKKPGRKPGPKPAVASASMSDGAKAAGGISLDDIRAVKQLADRLGAEKVRQLAEVLSK